PQPLLPAVGEGEQEIQSPSPLGEGFRVRATKVTCSRSHQPLLNTSLSQHLVLITVLMTVGDTS
ncbi:MAG: hypothetical protein WBA57_03355, partial [Elainellaceae cyanobacterium]